VAHRSEPGHADLDPHMAELGPEFLKVAVLVDQTAQVGVVLIDVVMPLEY
jgi:hypothetical protein